MFFCVFLVCLEFDLKVAFQFSSANIIRPLCSPEVVYQLYLAGLHISTMSQLYFCYTHIWRCGLGAAVVGRTTGFE